MKVQFKSCFSRLFLSIIILFAMPLPAEQLPAEAFTCDPKLENFRLSPNGTYITYIRIEGDKSAVMVTERAGGKHKILLYSEKGKGIFTSCEWVSETRLLCVVEGKFNRSVIGVNADGTDQKYYSGKFFGPRLLNPLLNDPDHILMVAFANYTGAYIKNVYKINLHDGNAQLWVPGANTKFRTMLDDWFANPQGTEFVNYLSDVEYKKQKLVVYTRGPGDQQFTMTGKFETAFDINFKPYADNPEILTMVVENLSPLSVDFTRRVYYKRDYYEGRLALFEYKLDNPTERKLLYSNPEFDIKNVNFSPKSELISADYFDNTTRLHYFNPEYEVFNQDLSQALPGINFIDNETH